MGAAILSTKGVVVSATMSSYLLLNKGHRFHFSNDFETLILDHFDASDDITDFILTSNNDGTSIEDFQLPYLKSRVCDYMCRPDALENCYVYDIYSQYHTTRGNLFFPGNLLLAEAATLSPAVSLHI